jgi:2-C-methyl-D-erythritol 4-phosphate cytidylyltransferase
MSRNIAVILAGGDGKRMGAGLPKQFHKVAGKTVIEHTVDAFHSHPMIDEISIVIHPDYAHTFEEYRLDNEWPKVKKVLRGGEKRYHSSLSAIQAYEKEKDIQLIFHDAVHPLVSHRIITDNIKALDKYDAVDTAVPTPDTIIQVSSNQTTIKNIPDRHFLQRGQTPQSFKLETIRNAYQIALKDPAFKTTDDCGIIRKYLPDVEIFVAEGEQQNIKLTYKEDAYLLDKLFQLKTANVSRNPDLKGLKDKVIVIFGGSSGIGAEMVTCCKRIGAKAYAFSRTLNKVDIRRPENVQKALKEVYGREGSIDCIVNTAAILSRDPLKAMSYEKIQEMMNINLKGVVNVALESFPYLKRSKGHLLFYTSSSYTRGRALYSIYSATKAAVVNFVQAVADEWKFDNISVNCVNPERTKTPMRTSNFGHEPEDTLLKAEEVAKVSLGVLCSGLNGQVVDIKIKKD